MGCFNVACSVSGISIGYGEKVRFIPLLPNNYLRQNVIKPRTSLNYSNCYFDPATFPISGTYDDYGSIENIVRDENVEAIEKRYGVDVKSFMDLLQCTRGLNDRLSEIFQMFAIHKDIFSPSFHSDVKTPMLMLGFKEEVFNEKVFFIHERAPEYAARFNGNHLIIHKNEEDKKEIVYDGFTSNSPIEAVLNGIAKLTGVYINYHKEDMPKIKELHNMSGMFIHEEIYQLLSQPNEELDDKYSERTYKELGEEFDKLVESAHVFNEKKEKCGDTKEELRDLIWEDPFGFHCYSDNGFLRYYKEWNKRDLFVDLYKPLIENGQLKKYALDFARFADNFSSMNKFYFPAMNGEQHANHEATKVLAEKTLEIVNNRIAEYE